jgi:hypothetical protein
MKTALAIAVILALPLTAGMTQYGLHGGIMMPTGDAGDAYNMSFLLGGQILVHMPMYAVEGSVSYVFLQPEADIEGFSAHMIPINLGVRSYSGPLFYGAGAGLYIAGVSWDVGADSTYEDSESDFGAYGTMGTSLPLGGNELELSGKVHWVDFDDIWIALQAGIYL